MKNTIIKIVALALIAVMACALLVACAPNSDPDKAVAALKENGYTAVKVDDYMGLDGVECAVTGVKGLLSGDMVVIVYFEDRASANAAWDELKEEAEDEENYVIEKSGKMIYFGTEEAVKAAR